MVPRKRPFRSTFENIHAPPVALVTPALLAAGGETPVNQAAEADQLDPAVAALAGGGHVVVWTGFSAASGTFEIYARHFDAAGAAQGGDMLVSEGGAFQSVPSLAALAGGGFVVVWQSFGHEGGDGSDLYARRYDAAGNALGGEAPVNVATALSQEYAAVAALACGGYAIVWQSGADIVSRRFDAAGAALGGEVLVGETAGEQGYPAIAGLAGGGHVLVWEARSGEGDLDLLARRYDAAGAALGAAFRVHDESFADEGASAVAALAGGGFVIAWQGDDGDALGVFARLYDVAGTPLGAAFRVSQEIAEAQSAPSVTALAGGGFAIAWTSFGQDGDDAGIFARHFAPSGAALGPEFRVNATVAGEQSAAAAAGRADGGLVIVWTAFGQDEAGGYGVYAQRYAASFRATEQVPLDLGGMLAIAGEGLLTITLSVDYGRLELGGEAGASVTLSGTLAELNALLASAIYTADTDAPPPQAVLTLSVDDGGEGGVSSASATIAIAPVLDLLTVGDRVWLDQNRNGVRDPGDPGIDGVTVEIRDIFDNLIDTTITAAGGYYSFSGLLAGDYVVRVDATTLPTGLVGVAGGADPDDDRDDDDNGGPSSAAAAITLSEGGEPTNDGDDDPNTNFTLDFGFEAQVNNAPVITSGPTGSVAENSPLGTIVYQATATDADDDAIGWSLSGIDAGLFTIDATGAVRLRASADYESRTSYAFTVVASDAAASTEQAITLSVTDMPVSTPVIAETAAANNTIPTAQAIDRGALAPGENPNLFDQSLPSATITGSVSTNADRDFFSITLQAGELLVLDVDGTTGGLDPLLRLFAPGGGMIGFNDDQIAFDPGSVPTVGPYNTDSQIRFRAETGGTYYFSIESYEASSSGNYQLQVSIGAPASGAEIVAEDVEALISGAMWDHTSLTYGFPTSAAQYPPAFEELDGFAPFSAAQRAATVQLLGLVEDVSGLTFTENSANPGQADLRYAISNAPSTAYAYYPTNGGPGSQGGTAWFNPVDYNNPVRGNYAWMTILHETGHALGLKHGHEFPLAISAGRDSLEYSVMTYRSWPGGSTSTGYTNEQWGYPQTLMMYDIAALQVMYGANYAHNAGSSVYTWSTTTGEMFVNGVGQGAAGGNRIFLTIWDGGGTDTYDFSNYATATVIDLRPGEWTIASSAQLANLGEGHFARGNIANALLFEGNGQSLIENATGSSAGDRIVANEAANLLTGNGGADQFRWAAAGDAGTGALADTIADFARGSDRIYLAQIDAPFAFIGTAGFGNVAGEVRYQVSGGDAHVLIDLDGDGDADMEIVVAGVTALDAADFLFTNSAPTLATPIPDQHRAEDNAIVWQIPAGTFTDLDGDTIAYSVGALPAWLSFNAGSRTFSGTPPLNFNGSIPIEVTASDGALTTSDIFNLIIDPVNDAPVIVTSAGTTAYLEPVGAGATFSVLVDPALLLSDVDDVALAGATVAITANYRAAEDVLSFVNTDSGLYGDIQASGYAGGALTLVSAGGAATLAQWQRALSQVRYSNSSEEPDQSVRTISFTANDGEANSNAATRQLSVTARNDPPTGTSTTVTINEDQVVTLQLSDFGFSDVDGDSLSSVVFYLPTGGTIYRDGTPLTFGPPTAWVFGTEFFDGSLTFVPNAEISGAGAAVLSFRVSDNGGFANGGNPTDLEIRTITYNITANNDAPVVAGIAGDLAVWDPGAAFTRLDAGSNAVVGDIDSTNFDGGSLTVAISGGLVAAEDRLVIDTSGSVSVSGNAVSVGAVQIATVSGGGAGGAPLIFSFDADATPAAVQTLIRAIGYANSAAPADLPVRTITWTLVDGDGTANGGADRHVLTSLVLTPNQTPTGTDGTILVDEDELYTLTAADFGFTDPDHDDFAGVFITTAATDGALRFNGSWIGVGIPAGFFVTKEQIDDGLLTFQSSPNENGAAYAGFTFQVRDTGGADGGSADLDPSPNRITFDVAPVEDAAVIEFNEPGAYGFNFTENAAARVIAPNTTVTDVDGFAFNGGKLTATMLITFGGDTLAIQDQGVGAGQIGLGPANSITYGGVTIGTYEPGTPWRIVVTFNGDATLAAAQALMRAFTYQYVGENPTAPLTRYVDFWMNDGVQSEVEVVRVTVVPVNDAPAGADRTISVNEDQSHTFTAANFAFTDAESHALASVRIASLPANGSLRLNGNAVQVGDVVTAAAITAGQLTFVPAANASGAPYASFTFQVRDAGGTANGGVDLDPSANTITLNVASVNDAPSGLDRTIAINEDQSHVFTAADFAFTDAEGHALASVRIASLPTNGALRLNGNAVQVGDVVTAAAIAAGQLTFAPAANASGAPYANFTFQVRDNGGTANGGVDLDPTANTITLNVASVNDAPSGTAGGAAFFEDESYVFTVADFAFTDTEGHGLASVTITTLPAAGTLRLNGVAVQAGDVVPVAAIEAGQFAFVPAPDGHGPNYAGFTFQVRDNGGTANGGVDLDPGADTFAITVYSVNDEPSGADQARAIDEDAFYTFASNDFGFSGGDGGSLMEVVIATLPATGTLLLNGAAVTAGQVVTVVQLTGGQLRYVPAADAFGAASFTFQVRDNGGTAHGGQDTDQSPNLFTITVNPINDAPTASGLVGDVATFTEGDAAALLDVGGNLFVGDIDSADFAGGTLSVGLAAGGEDRIAIIASAAVSLSGDQVLVGGVAIGSFTGGSGNEPLVVSFNAAATPSAVQALMRAIGYQNLAGDVPTSGARQVGWILTDGDGGTVGISSSVNVVAVNDAPTVDLDNQAPGSGAALGYTENNGATLIAPNATVIDPDTPNYGGPNFSMAGGLQVLITNGLNSQDVLSIVSQGDGPGQIRYHSGTVYYEGQAIAHLLPAPGFPVPFLDFVFFLSTPSNVSLEAVQALMRSIAYHNFSNAPDTTARTVEFRLHEPGSPSHVVTTATVAVAALDDAPTLALANPSVSYVENGAVAQIAAGATVADAEGDPITGATVTLTNWVVGDLLGYSPLPAGLSASITNPPGQIVLTLSGTASAADYAAAIGGLIFMSTGDNPTPGDRLITIALAGGAASASVTVTVSAVDDPGSAQADAAATNEATTLTGNVLGNDSDPDSPLIIGAVNGVAANVGQQILLASGARLTLNADGSYVYNPNGAFNATPAPGSGASNAAPTDSFTYTLAGGGSATVTVTINGLDSDDVLRGTAGADTLAGGLGNDVYYVESSSDRVIELAGQGYDRIITTSDFGLEGTHAEQLETANAAGTSPLALGGNAFNNVIYGNAGDNILYGKAGFDQLFGGAGNDYYYVSDAGDFIVELDGGGSDRILTSVDYGLNDNAFVEVLSTDSNAGTTALALGGNNLNNIIIGNDGNNILYGKGGFDTIYGRAGNDVYYVSDAGDFIVELAGEGEDRIFASVDYTLYDGGYVEVLSTEAISGTGAITLGGNNLANTIIGNNGVNTLYGKGGNDTLAGQGGADTFLFTSFGAGDVDLITDFAVGSDKIAFYSSVFTGLTPGGLPASAFVNGSAAADTSDRILYDSATGALFYDADGTGAIAAVQFATVTAGTNLSASDFIVF